MTRKPTITIQLIVSGQVSRSHLLSRSSCVCVCVRALRVNVAVSIEYVSRSFQCVIIHITLQRSLPVAAFIYYYYSRVNAFASLMKYPVVVVIVFVRSPVFSIYFLCRFLTKFLQFALCSVVDLNYTQFFLCECGADMVHFSRFLTNTTSSVFVLNLHVSFRYTYFFPLCEK